MGRIRNAEWNRGRDDGRLVILASHQRKLPDPDAVGAHREQCAFAQFGFEGSQEPAKEDRKFLRLKPLNSDSDYGRLRGSGDGHQRMEIGVERNDDAPLGAGLIQNQFVVSHRQTDIAHMHRVMCFVAEERDRPPRQSLIQEELHAILAKSTT